MRKLIYATLTTLAVTLVGCVTINVYFPAAAAQKAADQFVGKVLGESAGSAKPDKQNPKNEDQHQPPSAMLLDLLIPAAYAADQPDLRMTTPQTEALRARMSARMKDVLRPLLESGAIGFTHDGMVAMHDASKVPLSQRAQASAAIAEENRDRGALYQEIANANGHPKWEAQIRSTFATTWIEKAHAGWYYQDAGGAWKQR
ncbi:MAG: YdbL family protein [Rhodanobacter sp.]